MSTRREFVTKIAAGLLAANLVDSAATAERMGLVRARILRPSARIKAVVRRDDTVQRYAGVGDNWHMTWASNNKQYTSLCDGFGFSGQTKYFYNGRILAVEGGPSDARFLDLSGYPRLSYYPSQKLADARYYPFGTLAVDGRLYQFMSTFNRGLVPGDLTEEAAKINKNDPLRFIGCKLIYSPDNGRTWCNQDGSTPVIWESIEGRSSETMVFLDEAQEAFSLTTVLQMGRNYELNRDGYVYVYAPNGNTDGTMNELVLCRMPKGEVLNRRRYEYFSGLKLNGNASWSEEINNRKPVHTFPRGWVNTILHPYAWHPSVVFVSPLGVYMMANWGMGCTTDGRWFAKPSYLGFWIAPHPWGPWTQIHEEIAWTPAGENSARAYQPQIAPKWIAPDGKSFWLVWTDGQRKGEKSDFDRMNASLTNKSIDDYTPDDWALKYQIFRRFNPYYSFNAQRVDLVIA